MKNMMYGSTVLAAVLGSRRRKELDFSKRIAGLRAESKFGLFSSELKTQ
jgi:hypothetical protein